MVAILPHLGLERGVHVRLLGLLLLHQARDHQVRLGAARDSSQPLLLAPLACWLLASSQLLLPCVLAAGGLLAACACCLLLTSSIFPLQALLYFGYMFVATVVFFLLTGTIGFYACYWFVWKIFSAIKVD